MSQWPGSVSSAQYRLSRVVIRWFGRSVITKVFRCVIYAVFAYLPNITKVIFPRICHFGAIRICSSVVPVAGCPYIRALLNTSCRRPTMLWVCEGKVIGEGEHAAGIFHGTVC